MKKLLFALLAFSGGGYAQQFTIVGKVPFLKDGDSVKVRMTHANKVIEKPIAVLVNKGGFQISFSAEGAERYEVAYHKHSNILFLDPHNTTFEIADTSLRKIEVQNNVTANEYQAFQSIIESDHNFEDFIVERGRWYFSSSYNAKDRAAEDKEKIILDSLLVLRKAASIKNALTWVYAHPASQINGYVLLQYTTGNLNISAHLPDDELKALYNSLPDAAKQNSWSRELENRINGLFIGGHAPDFAQAGPDGKILKLSDFKGKYVLLDFWASWCKPCRAETPNVVKAYEQYKDHNFIVLSVSLDSEKKDWLKAITKDGMTWPNVSDLKHRQNEVSKLYNVNAIPDNFLIDPNGVIVARNLSGDKLESALSKFVK